MGDGGAACVPVLERRVLVGILAVVLTALLAWTGTLLWRAVRARSPLPAGAVLVTAALRTPGTAARP